MMIMSFSPFSFCWKFDYFQSKWRVARYKATIHDDKIYKKEEYDEYLNSMGRIEIKWVKIVNENWLRIINNLSTELNE